MAKPPAVDVQLTVKTEQYLHTAAVCPPMQIVFKDLTVNVQVKSRKEGWHTRTILHGVSGVLEPARFTAGKQPLTHDASTETPHARRHYLHRRAACTCTILAE
jgi:hypothetical protein